MGNFSKPPNVQLDDSLDKGYVGLHIEQGVPLLDRDLNLLQDLVAATVRGIIGAHIGDGVAAGDDDSFAIRPMADPAPDNDFSVGARAGGGAYLVGGMRVPIAASIAYSSQPGVPPLTTPAAPQPDPREDTVYLDAWVDEVTDAQDPDLANPADLGMRTSVRQKLRWVVRVAEGVPVPAPPPGHAFAQLATLSRPRGNPRVHAADIVDRRTTRLTLADLLARIDAIERGLPIIAGVTPAEPVRIGQDIAIRGQNFAFPAKTNVVTIGATQITVFKDDNANVPPGTQIEFEVPPLLDALDPGGTRLKMTVTNKAGLTGTSTILVMPAAQPIRGSLKISYTALELPPGQTTFQPGQSYVFVHDVVADVNVRAQYRARFTASDPAWGVALVDGAGAPLDNPFFLDPTGARKIGLRVTPQAGAAPTLLQLVVSATDPDAVVSSSGGQAIRLRLGDVVEHPQDSLAITAAQPGPVGPDPNNPLAKIVGGVVTMKLTPPLSLVTPAFHFVFLKAGSYHIAFAMQAGGAAWSLTFQTVKDTGPVAANTPMQIAVTVNLSAGAAAQNVLVMTVTKDGDPSFAPMFLQPVSFE